MWSVAVEVCGIITLSYALRLILVKQETSIAF